MSSGLHAPDLHQAGNAILTHTDTLPFEGSIHFRAAVAAFTLIEYPPDSKQQFCILRGPLPWLAIYPGVVPGARDIQVTSQGLYAVFSPVFPDEPERFCRSSA